MTKDSEGSKQEDTSQNSSNETNNEAANKANDADNIEEDEWMVRLYLIFYITYFVDVFAKFEFSCLDPSV